MPEYEKAGISSIIPLKRPSAFNIFRNLLSVKPTLQEALFYSHENSKSILHIISSKKIDVVYFDMIRLFRYALETRKYSTARIIYDLDDLLSLRYSYFMESDSKSLNLLGSYSNFIGNEKIKSIINTLGRLLLSIESRRSLKREIEASRVSNVILLTSPAEQHIYQERIKNSIATFTNFPVIEKPRNTRPLDHSNSKELIWLGNNEVPHNLAALENLIKSIKPKLKQHRLQIAGKTSGKTLTEFSGIAGIEFIGYVDDIDSFLLPGKILIAPFKFGTGIKIKLLEAIAHRVAVITNDIGFQGIPFKENTCFRPLNSDDDMIAAAQRLSSDEGFLTKWLDEQSFILDRYFSNSYELEILKSALD